MRLRVLYNAPQWLSEAQVRVCNRQADARLAHQHAQQLLCAGVAAAACVGTWQRACETLTALQAATALSDTAHLVRRHLRGQQGRWQELHLVSVQGAAAAGGAWRAQYCVH